MTVCIKPFVAVAVMGLIALPLSGCLLRERICREGERQVIHSELVDEVKAGTLEGQGGTACTENGEIPEGWTDYPPGTEPTEVYVDEQES
jgi:hypothetical protein